MSPSTEVSYQVNVPFSWEHKPGVSKIKHHHQESIVLDVWKYSMQKQSPPPPCPSKSSTNNNFSFHHQDLPFRLPALKAPSKISYFKKVIGYHREDEDPFLVAYKKCTTSKDHGKIRRLNINAFQTLSCKYSCPVAR
ncbi:uncharacterized protein LOC125369145 [Ricinus communis]|uniref:Uncharacterized protein n=1 Tax=Ricinus communis TaxID=3988 RepID=B9R6W0_RICCO|nr:uncharacterized protein LOC125369145 [Ricinus communis]EEF52240.1 conserved hypothetical protein [Ricinus communis]